MLIHTLARFPRLCAYCAALSFVLGSPAQAGPLDDARTAWQAGRLREAAIILKDALQRDPNRADARLLLAQVYLDFADAAAAEQELRRVRQLGGSDQATTLVPLARAWLDQGQPERVLQELTAVPDLNPAEQADLLALQGDAHLKLGDKQAAGLAYGQALELAPSNPAGLRGQVKLAFHNNQSAQVADLLAAAVAANPTDPETRILEGDLAFMAGRHADATRSYQQALPRARNSWLVHYKLALAQLEQGELAAAEFHLKAAAAEHPTFPPFTSPRARSPSAREITRPPSRSSRTICAPYPGTIRRSTTRQLPFTDNSATPRPKSI